MKKILVCGMLLTFFGGVSFAAQNGNNNGDPPTFKDGPFAVGSSAGSNLGGKHLQNVWATRPELRSSDNWSFDPPFLKNGPNAIASSVGGNLGGKHLQNVWAARIQSFAGKIGVAGPASRPIALKVNFGRAPSSVGRPGIAAAPQVRGRVR